MSDLILSMRNITKSYEVEGHRIDVLKGIDLDLPANERVSLTGKSGSGKSTLLNIMATLETPDSGEFLLKGVAPAAMSDRALSMFRNKEIGIVFQFHHLLPEFTALENVAVPLMLYRSRRESMQRAEAMLGRVGLEHRLNHKPAELSGGEQQRVAIARALVKKPSIVLADEPTGNLNYLIGEQVIRQLLDACRGKTLLCVTHDERLCPMFDRVLRLEEYATVKEAEIDA